MSAYMQASRAYQVSSDARSLRAQEADIFHRANGALRTALKGSEIDKVRAVADNRRLWLTVMGLATDPQNRLPASVRASLVSVGRSVQREMDTASPDLDFLIAVNENVSAGLSTGR
jgi:flagellar biosynthesis regulator FlaF